MNRWLLLAIICLGVLMVFSAIMVATSYHQTTHYTTCAVDSYDNHAHTITLRDCK